MRSTGPDQMASTERMSPTTKNGGSPSVLRNSQAFTTIAGPMPAGSPSAIASGASCQGSAIINHRVPTQIAQIAPRPHIHALLFKLGHDRLGIRAGRRLGIVAAANHQHAHAVLRRPEGRAGL